MTTASPVATNMPANLIVITFKSFSYHLLGTMQTQ
jgi:hypothetical protein